MESSFLKYDACWMNDYPLAGQFGHWAAPWSLGFSSLVGPTVLEWTNALISLILAYSLFQRLWSLALEPQQEGKAIAVLGPLSSFPVTII